MKIKIEKINKKQIYQYAELAPLDILEKAHSDETVTVVAYISKDEEHGSAEGESFNSQGGSNGNSSGSWTVAGIMQYSVSDSAIALNWIYVYYQYRNKSVGSELIKLLSDIPESSKIPIKVRLYDHMMDEMPISEVCSFLKKRGFDEGELEEGMYWLTGKYIFRNLRGLTEDEAASLKKSIVPFSRCTPDMLINSAQELKIKDKDRVLVSDKNLSVLLQSLNNYEGMLVAGKRGDVITVKEIVAASDSAKEKLLTAFFYRLIKRMQYTDKVLVSGNIVNDDIISPLFPNLEKENSFFLKKEIG